MILVPQSRKPIMFQWYAYVNIYIYRYVRNCIISQYSTIYVGWSTLCSIPICIMLYIYIYPHVMKFHVYIYIYSIYVYMYTHIIYSIFPSQSQQLRRWLRRILRVPLAAAPAARFRDLIRGIAAWSGVAFPLEIVQWIVCPHPLA